MTIPNELSSEIAVAILTEHKSPQELRKLKDILLQVHTALQKMSERTYQEDKPPKARSAEQRSDQSI